MPLGNVHFSDDFQPGFGIPWVPMPLAEELAAWPQEKLAEYLVFREQRNAQAIDNPVGAGWTLPMWGEVMVNLVVIGLLSPSLLAGYAFGRLRLSPLRRSVPITSTRTAPLRTSSRWSMTACP